MSYWENSSMEILDTFSPYFICCSVKRCDFWRINLIKCAKSNHWTFISITLSTEPAVLTIFLVFLELPESSHVPQLSDESITIPKCPRDVDAARRVGLSDWLTDWAGFDFSIENEKSNCIEILKKTTHTCWLEMVTMCRMHQPNYWRFQMVSMSMVNHPHIRRQL